MQTPSEKDGHYLKNNAGRWINEQVLSCMEDYIAGLEDEIGKHVIQFDKLKISLELKDGKLQNNDIAEQIRKQLDAQIRDFIRRRKNQNDRPQIQQATADKQAAFSTEPPQDEPKANILDPETREVQSLFHFLKTGRCPWWMSAPELTELLAEPQVEKLLERETEKFYAEFMTLLEHSGVANRLIRQFSDKILHKMLSNAFSHLKGKPFSRTYQAAFIAFTSKFTFAEKEKFWSAVIRLLLVSQVRQQFSGRLWADVIRPMLQFNGLAGEIRVQENLQHFPLWLESLTQLEIPEEIRESWLDDSREEDRTEEEIQDLEHQVENPEAQPEVQEKPEKELKNGIIAENAGLIILHPFLKNFLVKTELMDSENNFTDAELAVHVLHYIATGKQQDWDHNLLFEKFLCNLPLNESIAREREIPAEMLEEADILLDAVLRNWTALSNSSADLLRAEFLQRAGKLFMDEISVRLAVERKTHDILLDRLPWSISMTKLPWQQQLIYTTW